MTRNLIAAAAGCTYIALATWTIRGEGARHRAALRRPDPATLLGRREAPARLPIPVPSPPSPSAPPAPPDVEPAPTPQVPEPPPKTSPTASEPAAVAVVRPAIPPAPPEKGAEVPAPPALPQIRAEPRGWADGLDLSRLTAEEEARLGAELHAMVMRTHREDQEGADVKRVVRAAYPLLETVRRKDVRYTFTVLDSDVVSAFSLPGGFIYVCRGLFNLIGTGDEPALQFVLAHEIAHVDERHAITLLAPGHAEAKRRGIDTLTQFMLPIGVGYPDAQEFEADRRAYTTLTTRLGRTRRMALSFLRKFEGHAEKEKFVKGRRMPDPASDLSLVENHFRAHPAAFDRLDRLKALAVTPARATPPAPASSR